MQITDFLSSRPNWVPPLRHSHLIWVQGGRHTRLGGVGVGGPSSNEGGCWVVLETISCGNFTLCMWADLEPTKFLAHLKRRGGLKTTKSCRKILLRDTFKIKRFLNDFYESYLSTIFLIYHWCCRDQLWISSWIQTRKGATRIIRGPEQDYTWKP
jgi:hypothetical protein